MAGLSGGGRVLLVPAVTAVLATLPAVAADASARRCADRDLEYQAAPARVHAALVCEIGRVRARHDAGRLREHPQLELAAARHAADMVERHYFSHTSPGGGDVGDRARRAGYAVQRCRWRVGEVLAWGIGRRSTAAGTIGAWMDSPPHRRIVLADHYGALGVALHAGTPLDPFASGVTVAAVLGRRRC